MPAKLDNRPLLGEIDRDLFVPPSFMGELEAAIDRQLNVLVLGSRGSGKTTLLRALEAKERNASIPIKYVDLGPASDAEEALLIVAEALGQPWGFSDVVRSAAPTASSAILLRLVRRLADVTPTLILVDSPPGGGAAHTLFGRLRDELWRLPHRWVVAADEPLRDELTRPPANAFFDVSFELRPLTLGEQREFLARRLREEPGLDIEALVGETDGSPRSILELARTAVLSGVGEALAKRGRQEELHAGLTKAESAVVSFIADNGPTSGSDPQLLAALGVSGQRARQVLRGLEQRELLVSFAEQEERRGRPRKLYELSEAIR